MNNNSDTILSTKWNELSSDQRSAMEQTVISILTRQLFSDWQMTRKFDSMNEKISFEEYASRRMTFALTAPATIL